MDSMRLFLIVVFTVVNVYVFWSSRLASTYLHISLATSYATFLSMSCLAKLMALKGGKIVQSLEIHELEKVSHRASGLTFLLKKVRLITYLHA